MSLNSGDRLGDWIVVRPLGEGGMGSVYLSHSVLANDVMAALKVLTPGGSADFERRFVQELRTLSALKHPAIVGVQGGGRDEERGLLYMAMELIDGEDLADRLQRGPLSIDEANAVFGPVSEALAYAHGRGVAHRDIKPANIMLRKDGTPVIVDFGIAVGANHTRLTQDGMVPGTMIYLPPEVFEGDTPDPVSTDAYALGVVMWEAVTGKSPFGVDPTSTGGAAMAQIMGQKLRSEALDPGDTAPNALRDVIRRTTDPEPDTRLTDLAAIRDLLRAQHAPEQRAAAKQPKKRRGRLAAVLVVLTLLLALAVGAVLLLLGVAAGTGAWLMYGDPAPVVQVDRPVVDLRATLAEGVKALESGDNERALTASGRALDDHPDDPNANLLYGQALLVDGSSQLARPYLCAAVQGGLGEQVPGVKKGTLDCERGPGASKPLSEPLALASLDLEGMVEQAVVSAPRPARRSSSARSARPAPPPRPAPAESSHTTSHGSADEAPAKAEPIAPSRSAASNATSKPAATGAPVRSISAKRRGRSVASKPSVLSQSPKAPTGTPTATLIGDIQVSGELVQSSVVHTIVRRKIPALKTCYAMGLEYDAGAAGKVDFYVNINTDGRVGGVKFTATTLNSKAALACLLNEPKSWKFPADYGGTTVLKFTVVFERK